MKIADFEHILVGDNKKTKKKTFYLQFLSALKKILRFPILPVGVCMCAHCKISFSPQQVLLENCK